MREREAHKLKIQNKGVRLAEGGREGEGSRRGARSTLA